MRNDKTKHKTQHINKYTYHNHHITAHTRTFPGFGRDNDFGPEHPHEFPTFDGKGFRHGNDTRIPPLRTHHGDGNPGIATRRFDDGLPRLQRAVLLGRFNNTQRNPVCRLVCGGAGDG